ncbi:sugar ABC transporter ATP-binding protein [Paenibacillaceae bacterium WGS1546]|uniref:sugar ABC transporter ATP-binding protein n=1 Tax=Cohnella sp. WGS1546 TaxID=3366810 RepID=UPI00372D7CD2
MSFTLNQGEVHGLIGENGAGKSTLMKILSGAYDRDEGTIRIESKEVARATPKTMIELGVAVIYQEMTLFRNLSVAENIFSGRIPKTKLGLVSWKQLEADARAVLDQLELDLHPKTIVNNLNVAQRQMVEIAKALSRNAKIIVLDEPSAVLGDTELLGLFKVIRKLSAQGVSFIYISHRLSELFQITQRVTVLKDGEWVDTRDTEALNTDQLVSMMVGRELKDIYPPKKRKTGEAALEVRNLTRKGVIRDINLTVRQGEIVGIAGLAGSGRSEILRAIVGADATDSGEISVFGRKAVIRSPKHAIRLGFGYLPEDRKTEGLFLNQKASFNVTISQLSGIRRGALLDKSREKEITSQLARQLEVRPPDVSAKVKNFSGGNQQKFMFARSLYLGCKIILVDEPTRGVDVGAKREIYRLLADLADQGVAILMVSSELPEILGLSHRIMVVREGRLVQEIDGEEASEELIMKYAAWQGGKQHG